MRLGVQAPSDRLRQPMILTGYTFYAITDERRGKRPTVVARSETARLELFN